MSPSVLSDLTGTVILGLVENLRGESTVSCCSRAR